MRDFRSMLRPLAPLLLVAVQVGTAHAYQADEVAAILSVRPRTLDTRVAGVILACQRTFTIQTGGATVMEEHRLALAGPASAGKPFEMRWSFRPGPDAFRLLIGRVHHPDGRIETIPADSARVEPHRAAGPAGYPGVADWVVRAPKTTAGDVLEVKAICTSQRIAEPTAICGEFCFADADSVIESELNLVFPSVYAMLIWKFGALPDGSQSMVNNNLAFRWLTGHLPPMRPVARTATSAVGGVLPDSLSPPTLFFAFRTDWASVVAARSPFWQRALEATPPELLEEMRRILESTGDPEERRRAAVAWVRDRLRTLELPATRYGYEPMDPAAVLRREDAVPRDRAMILVWLLRHVGITADAVTVRSRPGGSAEVSMPQQFDLWFVRTRVGSAEPIWIDLRDEAESSRSIPPGPGVVWTAQDPDPPLTEFPGQAR